MKKENPGGTVSLKKIVRSLIIGLLPGAALTVLLLLSAAAVMVKAESVSYQAIVPIAIAAAGCGSFAAGYCSSRLHKSRGLLIGSAGGLLLFVISLVLGLAVGGQELGIAALLRLALCVLCGAAGGVLGVNKKRRLRRLK